MGFSDVIRESRMLISENVKETWIKKDGDEEEGNYRLLWSAITLILRPIHLHGRSPIEGGIGWEYRNLSDKGWDLLLKFQGGTVVVCIDVTTLESLGGQFGAPSAPSTPLFAFIQGMHTPCSQPPFRTIVPNVLRKHAVISTYLSNLTR